jgi:protein-L-isoaspartate(D-aspartate) O-methyltransferase
MVREQLAARGIRDRRVLEAMGSVPRERFVPEAQRGRAYEDGALPLPHGQAVSQPYVVGAMSEALGLRFGEGAPPPAVLEIGTGSGYQAAVLLAMGARVLTVERIPDLAGAAAARLAACPALDPSAPSRAGPAPGALRAMTGDGVAVASEHGPFDGILVTAAAEEVPDALLRALRVGARLVIPVGRGAGSLHVLERTASGVKDRVLFDVRFVPLLAGVASAGGPER